MAQDTLMDFPRVHAVLQDFARVFKEKYKERLTESDRIASGDLVNSVRVEVVGVTAAYEVQMTLLEYWKYVENGTRPHFPPLSAIQRWVEIKPVIPRPNARGKIPTTRQLAYLIARKISEVGTEGSFDYASTREEVMSLFTDRIRSALAEDVQDTILKVFG